MLIRDKRLPDPDQAIKRIFNPGGTKPPHRASQILKAVVGGIEYSIQTNRTQTRWWLQAIRPGSFMVSDRSTTTSLKVAEGWKAAIREAQAAEAAAS